MPKPPTGGVVGVAPEQVRAHRLKQNIVVETTVELGQVGVHLPAEVRHQVGAKQRGRQRSLPLVPHWLKAP